MDRLFAAPRDLPPNLESHRFWIWLQLILVRLYVRAVKGAEANFLYGLTRTGQVWLLPLLWPLLWLLLVSYCFQ